MQVAAGFDEFFVGAGAGIGVGDQAGFAFDSCFFAEVPGFPIIYVGAGLVEDDAGIGPDGGGELVVEAGAEHGPFSAIGVADDADAFGIDIGKVGQRVEAIR